MWKYKMSDTNIHIFGRYADEICFIANHQFGDSNSHNHDLIMHHQHNVNTFSSFYQLQFYMRIQSRGMGFTIEMCYEDGDGYCCHTEVYYAYDLCDTTLDQIKF